MKTIVTLFLFATLLFAQNPRVYSAIGDDIYINVDKIEKLKDISAFSYKKNKINKYVKEVKKNKELGFLIESGKKSSEKGIYLKKLRELAEINSELLRDVRINFKGSIKSEDSALFSKLVNLGLLNTDKEKKEIIKYYKTHTQEVEKSAVIETLFDEDLVLKKRKAARKKTYQQIQAAKIKRIKDRDIAKQKAIAKSLEEEVIRKKKNILNNQKIELSNP